MYSSIYLDSYLFDFIYYTNLFIICIRLYRTVIDQAGQVLYEDSGSDSVSMDIDDDDNQTVGCTMAHAARADFLSNSNSNDISDDDYESSCAETCYPVGVDHLRPTTDKPFKMYCYISPPKMYWYTLGQTVVDLAHRYRQTTNNVDRELTELP